MTTLVWIIPAALVILLMTVVVRRLLLHFLRFPHTIVLILATVASTASALAATLAFLPGGLASQIAVAVVVAGLGVGFLLTVQEFRIPNNG